MSNLRYHTAGESHGPAVVALVEGLPAGLAVNMERINGELTRRQGGYGRSGRQTIEQDAVRVLSGLLRGTTIGSPVALLIENKDHRIDSAPPVNAPRPGHADLAGAIKYGTTDCRPVLERASARETAARVAAGALARQVIETFGIECAAFVTRIGEVEAVVGESEPTVALRMRRDASAVQCPDEAASAKMVDAIRAAKETKDTLGGIVEVRVTGCPAGLGSCMTWQEKLDGRLMRAVGSIQAIKGVEVGLGFASAARSGQRMHDAILMQRDVHDSKRPQFTRPTNHAGGIEGGMSNGMPIVLRAAMKPISTLPHGLPSVDLRTMTPTRSDYERSDVCAVPAASVIVENVVAFEVAAAFLEKFGGDTLDDVRAAHDHFVDASRRIFNSGNPPA